jgi:hypothetical protein
MKREIEIDSENEFLMIYNTYDENKNIEIDNTSINDINENSESLHKSPIEKKNYEIQFANMPKHEFSN